jgi:hypothetical protein
MTIDGNVNVNGAWNNTGGGNISISGEVEITGTLTLTGNKTWASGSLDVDTLANNISNSMNISGDLTVRSGYTKTVAGNVYVLGNVFCGGNWGNGFGGTITIKGSAFISGTITIGTGAVWTSGDLHCGEINHPSASAFTINGNLIVDGTVTKSGGSTQVDGNVQIGDSWNNTGGGNIQILGKILCRSTLTLTGATSFSSGAAHIDNVNMGGSAGFVIYGDLIVDEHFTNSNTSTVLIYGNAQVGSFWNNGGGGNVSIGGETFIGANITINGADSWTSGALHCAGDITNTSTGAFIVNGNLEVNGDAVFGGVAIAVTIKGNAFIKFLNNSNTGTITFNGDLEIITLTNSNAGGTVLVTGFARIFGVITNAGTLTYKGVHPETAVTFNATNVAADVFHLAAASGFHHIVDKVRIKCADPGAQTVAINLLELINGVLTQVDSFTITTANFTTYFSLMDMFGIDHLAGDELQITALASDAGPYAVTGSYAYRSA